MRRIKEPWQKLVSGLYVPPYIKFAPGYPCCCEDDCGCSLCGDSGHCCIDVELPALATDGCKNCLKFVNSSGYALNSKSGSDCVWEEEIFIEKLSSTNATLPRACAFKILRITLFLDGSDHKVKAEIVDSSGTVEHRWEKNIGASLNCASGSHDLTNTLSSGGDCISTGTTVNVNFNSQVGVFSDDSCGSDICMEGTLDNQIQLELSGVVNAGGNPCVDCADFNSEIYILGRVKSGAVHVGFYRRHFWVYFPASPPEICGFNYISLSLGGGGWVAGIEFRTSVTRARFVSDSAVGVLPYDCGPGGDMITTGSWFSNTGTPDCDFSSATIALTVL